MKRQQDDAGMGRVLCQESPQKLAYTIPELCAATGISRAMIYKEIKANRLRIKKIGARTIVPIDEARAWLQL